MLKSSPSGSPLWKPIAVLLLWGCVTVSAQGVDIRGVISDSVSGRRLASVNVVISGIGRGAVTNASGFYLIPAISPGVIEITASCVGYQSQTRSLRVERGSPLAANFLLAPRLVEEQEVVVEGRRGRDTASLYSSLHTIHPGELEGILGPVQGDVFRSLTLLPGVISTADVSSKFYVRGGAGDQNLILFDGMKIHNPYHAMGTFSAFDPDIVGSVDLYTGGFPPGYSGKLSSVLEIRPRDGNASRFSGGADLNSLSSRLRLEGPIGEANAFIVSGQKSIFTNGMGSFLKDPPPVSFYDLFLKATFGSSTGRVSIRGFISSDNVTPEDPVKPKHSWRTQAAAASASLLLSDWTYFDAIVTSSRTEMNRDPRGSNSDIAANSVLLETDLRAELMFYSASEARWIAGFESALIEADYSFTTSGGVQRPNTSIQPDLELWVRREQTFGNVKADFGVQIDVPLLLDGGANLQSLQPRLNATYAVAPGWRAKASYGVFTQKYIALTNEDDVTSLLDGWIYLPDNLRPEEAHHYVVGLETELSASAVASLVFYDKEFRSIALYNREKVYPGDPDYITGTGRSYGFETLFRFTSVPLDLFASYALSWATVTSNGLSYAPRYDRRHSVNLLGIWHAFHSVDLSLRWEFGSGYPFSQNTGVYNRLNFPAIDSREWYLETGSRYITLGSKNAARLPAYHRLDASATYRFSLDPVRVTAGIYIVNVYDNANLLYVDRKTGEVQNMIPFYPSASIRVEF